MGEQNDQKEFYFTVDGVNYSRCSEIKSIDPACTTELDVAISMCSFPDSIKCEIKPQKRYRATNRKRYVKLLMADGMSRNEANEIAKLFQKSSWSYQADYFYNAVMRRWVFGEP